MIRLFQGLVKIVLALIVFSMFRPVLKEVFEEEMRLEEHSNSTCKCLQILEQVVIDFKFTHASVSGI